MSDVEAMLAKQLVRSPASFRADIAHHEIDRIKLELTIDGKLPLMFDVDCRGTKLWQLWPSIEKAVARAIQRRQQEAGVKGDE